MPVFLRPDTFYLLAQTREAQLIFLCGTCEKNFKSQQHEEQQKRSKRASILTP